MLIESTDNYYQADSNTQSVKILETFEQNNVIIEIEHQILIHDIVQNDASIVM